LLSRTYKQAKWNKELVVRIGNHKLMIETGRCSQIPRVNRLCPTCGYNQIEDEIHWYVFTVLNTQVFETGFTGK